MSQSLKDRYPEVATLFDLYCHANNFDMDGFREQVRREKWLLRHPTFKQDFKRVIDDRLITMDEHIRLTEVDFDTDDELFAYLQRIYDHVYNDGPYPVAFQDA